MQKNPIRISPQQLQQQMEFICQKFKRRVAGSAAERECQTYFAQALRPCADTVQMENFTLHPRAFLGWIGIAAVFAIGAAVLFVLGELLQRIWLWAVAAFGIGLTVVMFWQEFLRYETFVDPLFKKATSCNVYAVRNSAKEPKRRIIFGGHADAAYEFTFVYQGKGKFILPLIRVSVFGIFFLLLSCLAGVAAGLLTGGTFWGLLWKIVAGIQLALIPAFVSLLFFVNWNCVTDGANDNLSACFSAMAVLQELEKRGIRFEHTQVGCLITGAEEEGLRGAYAFADAHQSELEEIETVFIAMDTLHDPKHLQIYPHGMCGLEKADKQAVALLRQAGRQCGIELKDTAPYPGATDADAFSKRGLKACGLCAVDHQPQSYYHTRLDTADQINLNCMELCMNICMEAVSTFDQYGLESN